MEKYNKPAGGLNGMRFIRLLKSHIKAVAVIMVISLVIGFCLAESKPKIYSSSATMAVMYTGSNYGNQAGNYNFSSSIVETFVQLISENIVLEEASSHTGYSKETLKNNLTVSNRNLLISLSYTDKDPQTAQTVLNGIMNAAILVANQTDDNGNPVYPMLSDGLMKFSDASNAKEVSNTVYYGFSFFVFGAIGGCLYVFLCWLTDQRYKDPVEVEEDFDLPVLTTVPYYIFNERKQGRS